MKRMRIVLSIACMSFLILGLVLTSCSPGEGEDPIPGPGYYPWTKILGEEEAENIAEVAGNGSSILFSETTAFVASLEPGDVLVYDDPVPGAEHGLLGRVTGVSPMGDGLLEGATALADGGTVVEIEPATMEDAIEEWEFSVNTTIPKEDLMSYAMWTTGVEVLQTGDGYDFSYSEAGVTIEGHLLVTRDTEIYIEGDIFSGLEEFEFIFSPGFELEADLTVEESVSWNNKYSLGEVSGPPIPIWGPVTIIPSIELFVGTSGELTGTLEAGVDYERIYDVGIRYYDGAWSTINELRGDGATLEPPPSFSGQAEARVYAGAMLSGTAGISYIAEAALRTELLGNIRATGEIETSPWQWQYDIEMYLTAQVFADLYLCRIAHVGWESDVWQYPTPPVNLRYGASGRVTTEGDEGLAGVEISFSGGYSSVTTDEDGYWSKHLLSGDVVATPHKTSYEFDPVNRTITGSASNYDFQEAESEWEHTDYGSGPSHSHIQVDPTNSDIAYIGGWHGMFKTTDAGETVTPVSGLESLSDIGDIDIDPNNTDIVYVCDDSDGLYKTTDGGANWDLIASGWVYDTPEGDFLLDRAYAMAIHPDDSSILFLNADDGIFKSTDSGSSWTWIGEESTEDGCFVINPDNPDVMYLAYNEVKKSTDGGYTWTDVSPGLEAYSLAMDPQNPTVLYAGGRNGADGPGVLLKTTNGGSSWTSLTYEGGWPQIYYALAVDPVNSDVYVGPNDDIGILKSTDGGSTWNFIGPSGVCTDEGLGIGTTPSRVLYTGSSDAGAVGLWVNENP